MMNDEGKIIDYYLHKNLNMYRIIHGESSNIGKHAVSPFMLKKTKSGIKLRYNIENGNGTIKFSDEELNALTELLLFYKSCFGNIVLSVESDNIQSSDITYSDYPFYSPYL